MSLGGQDFGKVARPEKHISEYTDEDVQQAIAAGEVWSEELGFATRMIARVGDADLKATFHDVLTQVLSGSYQDPGGRGFSLRDSIGHAVQDMLGDKADMGRFTRLLHDTDYKIGDDKMMRASLKALKAEIKAHVLQEGRTLRDGYDPEERRITFADGQKL